MTQKYLEAHPKEKQETQMINDHADTFNMTNKALQPLNRILFGAAGTGKTFNTINHALLIIKNESLESLETRDRIELKKEFDKYKDQGRIKFVTFHQSFSYEDFVEGIRAETDEKGNLMYKVESGVFKEICDHIKKEQERIDFGEAYITDESIKNALDAFIGKVKTEETLLHTKTGAEFKLKINSNGKITACAVAGSGSITALSHPAIVRYLKDQSDEIITNKSYEWAIAYSLRSEVKYGIENTETKPYILIIDEINRGNISRIFGELITLIEDSKCKGATEELSVTLPYSKQEFLVPQNLYIIGTMNSSDRSLTGLDIALRRRFTFIEMPPKPELLNDIFIDDLNIGELLKVMNQRIEVLLDRDHCIGHANFMSLKSDSKLDELAQIFKQKIIPQLQEYFFDDWSKINMVLNNNGMFKAKAVEKLVLFPDIDTEDVGYFEEQKIWELVDFAFESIESFTKIIKH